MKYNTTYLIKNQVASANITSAPLDMNQIIKLSGQVIVGSGTATGTMQLQVSDDPVPQGYNFAAAVFTNWSNLGSPISISAPGSTLIAQQDTCYRALRIVYTDGSSGLGTSLITVQIMTMSV